MQDFPPLLREEKLQWSVSSKCRISSSLRRGNVADGPFMGTSCKYRLSSSLRRGKVSNGVVANAGFPLLLREKKFQME